MLQAGPERASAKLDVFFVRGRVEQPSNAVLRDRNSLSCICSLQPLVDCSAVAVNVSNVDAVGE